MAKVLKIEPKDVYVTVEFSLHELDLLKTGIALAHIDYDGKDKEQAEAVKEVKSFWGFLDDFLQEVKRHGT